MCNQSITIIILRINHGEAIDYFFSQFRRYLHFCLPLLVALFRRYFHYCLPFLFTLLGIYYYLRSCLPVFVTLFRRYLISGLRNLVPFLVELDNNDNLFYYLFQTFARILSINVPILMLFEVDWVGTERNLNRTRQILVLWSSEIMWYVCTGS